ncbi:hypothetical protein PCANC_16358 [Puccinia coronata f. sp. avenae]|uniref:Zn(2)-C6 fungal-type domain-containing protein n=1 Tax=Puccinia coronata f. sp. avenae TaxID=200324 RepID=A0A2N5UQQ7_9BASI|nr:hypothetical protein PCANC_16358 [Puccinia coronata f. sp. avenae]
MDAPPARRKSSIKPSRQTSSVLHRNKACLSCRARKTKCDAVKPICSSCKRLNPHTECKYDQPPKWLQAVVSLKSTHQPTHNTQITQTHTQTQTQTHRIKELELKLESLQSRLTDLRTAVAIQHATTKSNTGCPDTLPHSREDLQRPTILDHPHSFFPPQTHQYKNTIFNYHPEINSYNNHLITHPVLRVESPSPSVTSSIPDPAPSSPHHHHPLATQNLGDSSHLPLSEPNWYSHLPSRKVCKLLIKAFFNRPLAPFTLVEPVGLQSRLDLPIHDPRFPQPALIHAICATGSQYISRETLSPIYWCTPQGPHVHHAQWAERLLNAGITQLRDPRKLLELAEAAVLCCQYYTVVGKPLMIWKSLGCCIRLATLVGLHLNMNKNSPASLLQHTSDNMNGLEKVSFWPDGVELLDRPSDPHLQHYRTILWWYVFCCDKMCAAAGGFASTVDEKDSLIPISSSRLYRVHKQHERRAGGNTKEEQQEDWEFFSPGSPSFFFKHRTGDLGSLQLLIKTAILLGKVNTTVYRRSHPAKTAQEIQQEHESLSHLIWGLYHSIPACYKDPFKLTRYGQLDACLLSAHTFIHTSLIQLNEDLVCLDHHAPSEDGHLQICKLSGQLMMDWFLQLIQQKTLGLISVDLGQLLCGNPTLNFGLSVAMRTHCRLVAINRVYTPSARLELDALTFQIEHILSHLSKSPKMPLEGRIIELISGLLQAPYSLLPRSLLFPPLDPASSFASQQAPDQYGHESMKSNFALARLLTCSSL